jgi:putative oxidoreductase
VDVGNNASATRHPFRPTSAVAEIGMSFFERIASTRAPAAVVLIRIMVGAVFTSEGIQKFLFPNDVGAGRFAKIGLPSPESLAPFVGTFEIVCGTLVLLGLFTRPAVIPLLTIMSVAMYTTKLPIFVKSGFWKMAHEARTDFSMFLGSLFLLIVGAGMLSLDAKLSRKQNVHGAAKP